MNAYYLSGTLNAPYELPGCTFSYYLIIPILQIRKWTLLGSSVDLTKVTEWWVAELGNEPQRPDSRALALNHKTQAWREDWKSGARKTGY